MSAYRKGLRTKAAEHLALAQEFYSRYQSRIVRGLATYGEFVPATDRRILSLEAQEEALDIGSYLEMLEQKHPDLASKINKIRAKTILLYGDLKVLEAEERTLTREGDL